jgi:5'(3')-deoxyribonucleotidase
MRFLIDVDDVLTDFVQRLTPILSGVLGRDWSYDEIHDDEWNLFTLLGPVQTDAVFALMERPGFCMAFHPAEGAQEAVAAIRSLGLELYAVTAPNYFPYWCSERTTWLERHFKIPASHVVHTHAKHIVKGDFFLDDRPSHVVEWARANPEGVAMLWTTPHNQRTKGYGSLRVHSWDSVLDRIKAESVKRVLL